MIKFKKSEVKTVAIGKDVKVIEYSGRVDFFNCLTHGIGAVLSVLALSALLMRAEDFRSTFSAAVYGMSLLAVYTASAVYHGLKAGEGKRIARLVDHSAVPLLIAGTATPCALISLYSVSRPHGILVCTLGWLCALFGIFSKLFFFEKLKRVTMAVYIASGTVMLLSAVPLLGQINKGAFGELVIGGAVYVVGAIFCGLGVKRPYLHIVFHLFVMAASALHFYVILNYCF